MAASLSVAAVQAMGAALATDIGSAATIEIRTGTKPATPETAATGTLLATVAITGSFTSSSGSLTAADPGAVTVANAGTAGYFRIKTSGGVAKLDGTVGTSSADLIVATTSFVAGAQFDLGVPTIAVPVA